MKSEAKLPQIYPHLRELHAGMLESMLGSSVIKDDPNQHAIGQYAYSYPSHAYIKG